MDVLWDIFSVLLRVTVFWPLGGPLNQEVG